MKLFLKPEYEAVSIPKDVTSSATLERECLEEGILQPLLCDTSGGIMDGMERFRIAQRHSLEYEYHVLKSRWGEEQRIQWVASKVLHEKKPTNQQMMLSRYHMIKIEPGNLIKDRALSLAKRYPSPDKQESTVASWYITAHAYGELATCATVSRSIYEYIWKGGAILHGDLKCLSELGVREQEVILKMRQDTSKPWKHCILANETVVTKNSKETLLDHLRCSKRTTSRLKRWILSHRVKGSDIGKACTDGEIQAMEDYERVLIRMMNRIENL